MEQIKCVLFDLDNTLINRQKAARKTIEILIKRDFPEIDEDEFEERVQRLYDWDQEGHLPKEEVFTPYIKTYGIQGKTVEDYELFWKNELPLHTIEFKESVEVLEYVKQKYRIGLITNGGVDFQREKLKRTSFTEHFEMILISGELDMLKPDKRVFLEACRRMNVLPEECIYVGDGLVNDVIGSAGVGMIPIWVHPDVKRKTEEVCQRIYHIKDLLQIL